MRWTYGAIPRELARRLRVFVRREWASVFLSSAAGVLCASIIRLAWADSLFQKYCLRQYGILRADFGGLHSYSTYLWGLSIALALAAIPKAFVVSWKGIRSWVLGITSGLCLASFLSTLFSFLIFSSDFLRAARLSVATIGIISCISFAFYSLSLRRSHNQISEEMIRVSESDLSQAGTSIPTTDDPIASWAEDLLDRAPIVNSVSFSLLISRTPVLALQGPFGSGKTSILNLLARHLSDKALVVYFSSWLPGSADTLSSYLLEDISKVCRKSYVVPGIQRSARKLALALAERVHLLNLFPDFLSASTQRDEIQRLTDAVARLPRRVVVLLDEVDRMDKPQLDTLLKVLRGLSLSSNLSFVCAFDREKVERTVTGNFNSSSNIYFEKFFPISVGIPPIDEDSLKTIGVRRLSSALDRRGWFEGEADREGYEKEIGQIWSDLLSPFCATIREIGLLANDVSAPAQLKGEINLIDLTLIELLRRFEPAVHEIVWRYREIISQGERSLERYRFRSDQQEAVLKKKLGDEVDLALKDNPRAEAVKEIFGRLFPKFEAIAQLRLRFPLRRQKADENANRISDPGVMRTYFHQKLGEDEFSSREMRKFIRELESTDDPADVRQRVLQTIRSMEKGNPKRREFLDKLGDQTKKVKVGLAMEIAHTCVCAADLLTYDFFFSVGESGAVLSMVIKVADREEQNHQNRVRFLGECIREAGDDTMALRILRSCSKPGVDFDLQISFAELYPHFIERMNERYGSNKDPHTVNLLASDRDAFTLWGFSDLSKEGLQLDQKEVARNRAAQRSFWLGHIRTSRKRLAEVLSSFFFPEMQYDGDPRSFIEYKIPIADLKRLYESTEDDGSLTIDDHASLAMLGRILKGEFLSGAGPFEWQKERERIRGSGQAKDPQEAE